MKVSRQAIRHPVIIGMLLIVLMAFGFYSFTGQNIEFMSDINLPSILVLSIYPGAGAEDVEQEVTSILEDEFVTLPNYKSMDSVSSNSMSMITIYYQDGADPYDQLEEVRYRIATLLSELPKNLQGEPIALVGGATMLPILTFSLSGGKDIGRVTSYVQGELLPAINQIKGVAEVTIHGGQELEAFVQLRLDDLSAKEISVTQVFTLIDYANSRMPLGSAEYRGKTLDLRYGGSFTSLEDLKGVAVGFTPSGTPIRLEDVATVSLQYPKQTYAVQSDEEPLIVANVTKRTDGNIVRINKAIRALLLEEEEKSGGALSFSIIGDDSRTTMASLYTVIRSGLAGIIMAILVIVLFLGDTRSTLIIGFSIPLSLLFAFIGMRLMGITVNLMSLSGLVAALGMVVDGSIVMLEQIYRYYRTGELTVTQSIDRASDEVGPPILASTLTTVVVFIPISMLSGIIGMIFKDIAITLILALAGSFLVAVVFVPFFAKLLLRPTPPKLKDRRFNRMLASFEKGYKRALDWSLSHSAFILVICIAVLAMSAFTITKLGFTFLPSTDNSDFYVHMEFPQGYSLEQSRQRSAHVESLIRSEVSELQDVITYAGMSDTVFTVGSANVAYSRVVLVPVAERKRSVHEIMLSLQALIANEVPDITVRLENGGFDKLLGFVTGGGGYGITLVSEDLELLYHEARRIQEHLQQDKAVVSTRVDTSFDANQLVLKMDRSSLNRLGINSYEAALTSRILVEGMEVSSFTDRRGERYAIRVGSDATDRPFTTDTLNSIMLHSMGGSSIPLSAVAKLEVQPTLSEINHTDRAKTITIGAALVDEDTSMVLARMNEYLEAEPLADGVKSLSGGVLQLIEESIPPVVSALLIAWFLVYTVMVIQFERFRQPAIIIVSIPFCIIGVVLGLLGFGSTLSIVSLLGIIALGGIVVNNGIILIDYVNLLRRQKNEAGENHKNENPENTNLGNEGPHMVESEESLLQAITEGSASRLRPIFMTTITTMLGVVPMALAAGEGAEIYAPLGQAIAGGLFSSTLITLFIIPVLYYLTERRVLRKKARRS
ncbi:MAG: efflux RND transporter permease subunit [Sphaerochaeta sp.]|nr:efflux RND transporter permease subunit [Sphaerochaeta sp.]